MTPDPGRHAVVALGRPEGCRRLSAAWAGSYDADVAARDPAHAADRARIVTFRTPGP